MKTVNRDVNACPCGETVYVSAINTKKNVLNVMVSASNSSNCDSDSSITYELNQMK
jgi:hypothetical protein